MKKNYFILFITLLFSMLLLSQRNCGTMQYLQQQINENPSLQKMNDNEPLFTKLYSKFTRK